MNQTADVYADEQHSVAAHNFRVFPVLAEVISSVRQWRRVASQAGLGRGEQAAMAPAFNV